MARPGIKTPPASTAPPSPPALPVSFEARRAAATASRRIGEPVDIAEIVRFLAGSESSWITGVNIPIDGGHHLRQGADYGKLFG